MASNLSKDKLDHLCAAMRDGLKLPYAAAEIDMTEDEVQEIIDGNREVRIAVLRAQAEWIRRNLAVISAGGQGWQAGSWAIERVVKGYEPPKPQTIAVEGDKEIVIRTEIPRPPAQKED